MRGRCVVEAGVANDTGDPSQASCQTGEKEDIQEEGAGTRRTTQLQKRKDATLTTQKMSLSLKKKILKSTAAGKTKKHLNDSSHCRSTESSSSLFSWSSESLQPCPLSLPASGSIFFFFSLIVP